MSDLHELTATEQLKALRRREVSSLDLTEHYLDRIERLGPRFGAFTTVTADLAREEATRADQRLARGETAPLLGLPLAFKDMHATRGVRTTLGSAALTEHVPTEDAWTVGLLRRAGAVTLGMTSSSELGATCYVDGERPAVTPYDPSRYSSGSSGGAAAAVAAGLLPAAHASDGAGSTRTPASTCHLVGVKPSRGLVSAAPATSFVAPGSEGPIARTVQDAALLLDVMAQPWPGDLHGWRPGAPLSRLSPPQRLRVAWWTDTGLDSQPHPEAVHAVASAAALLRELGHEVEEIAVPARCDPLLREALRDMFASSLAAAVPLLVPAQDRHLLTPYTRLLLERGEQLSGTDVLQLQGVLARYASTYLAVLHDVDVALLPTTNGPPVPVGHYDHGDVAELMLAWSCFTPWANLTGQPAVSVPCHVDADGLPQGVQLVGRPRHDATVLALAAQLEAAGLWSDTHPPSWDE